MTTEKWDGSNIGDQNGRVAIVTGSSSGIGLQAAKVFAEKNATVIIAVRNAEKGAKAKQSILDSAPQAAVEVMDLDLSDLASTKRFADAFANRHDRLDILVNNAGVMMPPYAKTKDGIEIQIGTNHFGHYALTGHLLPLLKKTKDSRVVNVSSLAHTQGKIEFDDLNWEKRKYKTMQAYGDSKIANLYFTYELANRLGSAGRDVVVTAAHPGWTATDLQRHSGLFAFLNPFFAQDIPMGTLPTLRAAIDSAARSGDYYGPDRMAGWRGHPTKVKSNKRSHDSDAAKRLWDVSEKLTGVRYDI